MLIKFKRGSYVLSFYYYYFFLKLSDISFTIQVKGKPGQNGEAVSDEYQKDENLLPSPVPENLSDKENKSEAQFGEPRKEKSDSRLLNQSIIFATNDDLAQDDASDEGWQEAVPKGRSLVGRKSTVSRRPSLEKLNTNFINTSQSSRYRGKANNFTSPKTSPNEPAASTGLALPVSKKFVKSASFSPKPNNSSTSASGGAERLSNPKSAPSTPASVDQVVKSVSPVSVQSAGKLFSYKEVALAPPGTIVKAVAEHLPKGNLPIVQTSVGQETPTTEVTRDVKEEKNPKPTGEKQISVSEKSPFVAQQRKVQDSVAKESLEAVKHASVGVQVEAEVVELENTAFEGAEVQTVKVAVPRVEKSDTSQGPNSTASESRLSEALVPDNCPRTSSDSEPPSVLTENTALLLGTNLSNTEEGKSCDLPNGDVVKPVQTDGEKVDEQETGKEMSKKLSAAAPPFNPSLIPVFGSIPVPVPSFKDHGGILPPPVNIPPMLTVSPVRRSPHQSATARVPYGPRLSGGYNRSGSRVSRNKHSFHNGEHTGDGPPRIMNPHAAEFVPGQPWGPNGYPVSPNGFLPYPNGYPMSPNGYLGSPNGTPVTQNGSPTSPVSSDESSPVLTADLGVETNTESAPKETDDKSSIEVECETQPIEGELQEEQSVDNVNVHPEIEEKPIGTDTVPGDTGVEKETSNLVVEEKPSKCWGDYSDNEAEVVEVSS